MNTKTVTKKFKLKATRLKGVEIIFIYLEEKKVLIKSFKVKFKSLMTSEMISDETFPQELQIEDEENEIFESICTTRSETRSYDNLASYFSAENSENSDNSDNSTDINHSLIETSTIALLIKSSAHDFGRLTNSERDPKQQQQHPEASFKSISDSAQKLMKIPPPKAPIKKRKSYSCHDLQLKKNSSNNNYDHVESKVKKLIENLAPENRRKSFSRTKSLVSFLVSLDLWFFNNIDYF